MEPIATHMPHSAREVRTITSCHVWINHSFSHTLATQSHLWVLNPKNTLYSTGKKREIYGLLKPCSVCVEELSYRC